MRTLKKLVDPPVLYVFLSFLFGLSNFVDTLLRLFYRFMFNSTYPLGVSLKPVFFVLQAFCLMGFLFQMIFSSEYLDKRKFWGLLVLHLSVLATTILLFSVFMVLDHWKYGVIVYVISIFYMTVLCGTCLWFFSELLREKRFRMFSIVFLFMCLAFFANFVNEIYLWPSHIEPLTMYSPAILMELALFYTGIRLFLKKKVGLSLSLSRASIFRFVAIIIALLLPTIWNNYKNGLINLIIGSIVGWGLGYNGYGWYSISLYLTSFIVYIFLVKHLNENLDHTSASYLILLGVISFPWNGLTILDLSYSSIPGNILSLDALILGLFAYTRLRNLGRHPQQRS